MQGVGLTPSEGSSAPTPPIPRMRGNAGAITTIGGKVASLRTGNSELGTVEHHHQRSHHPHPYHQCGETRVQSPPSPPSPGASSQWQVTSGKSAYWELRTVEHHHALFSTNTTINTNTTMRGNAGAITTIGGKVASLRTGNSEPGHWELWNTTINGHTTNTTMRGNAGAITTIGRGKVARPILAVAENITPTANTGRLWRERRHPRHSAGQGVGAVKCPCLQSDDYRPCSI
jgi:hypothetical protein